MPSKKEGPGDPEMFTKLLRPEAAAVVPEVAATITDVEEQDISTIRETATVALSEKGLDVDSLDVSRVALAARLQKLQEGK